MFDFLFAQSSRAEKFISDFFSKSPEDHFRGGIEYFTNKIGGGGFFENIPIDIWGVLFPIKIFLIAFSIFLFIFTVILMIRTSYLRYRFFESLFHFFVGKPFGVKKYTKEWNKILDRVEKGEEADYKIAIIEADDLLSTILVSLGYKGDNLEEQLKKVSDYLVSNKEDIIMAHRVRSDLVYDPSYKITKEKASEIIKVYEKALRDLEYI